MLELCVCIFFLKLFSHMRKSMHHRLTSMPDTTGVNLLVFVVVVIVVFSIFDS